MDKSLTLEEILKALYKCWTFANETTDDGTFVRPDYRRGVSEVWEDLLVATQSKYKREDPSIILNQAMAKMFPVPEVQ